MPIETSLKDTVASFLDAAQVAEPSEVDREHLTEEGHAALADAVYEIVKNLD